MMEKDKQIIGKIKTAILSADNAQVTSNAKYGAQIAPKSIARTRQDIASWNQAIKHTRLLEYPKWFKLQQLYDEILTDALLTSQIKNRQLKSLSKKIVLKNKNGEVDIEQSAFLNNSGFTRVINTAILESNYRRVSLIELSLNINKELIVENIPRHNIDPVGGYLYPDYNEDKTINYRDASEYNTWLLEFNAQEDVGLLNKAIPHVLFKRFAQSCHSELCEIYGIPPRVMKTNTQDPQMISRAERMMRDVGAAAWYIIDESEKFEFAQGVATNGEVYTNLINLCNNENSLLITGAIIGQDTKNGSNNKDQSAQQMLEALVDSDLHQIKQHWNELIIPALVRIGILKGELFFGFEESEDLTQLWTWTKEIPPYKNIEDDWIKQKFGIEVTGDRVATQNNENLGLIQNSIDSFFD